MIQFGISNTDRKLFHVCKDVLPRLHGAKLSGSQSGFQSELQSGSRSRRCTGLHETFIVQHIIAHHITLSFIVQSLLHRNPPLIWIQIIRITIQIECLHRTKFLDPDRNLDRNPDNFALHKGIYFAEESGWSLKRVSL